jgi:hypothetical protein
MVSSFWQAATHCASPFQPVSESQLAFPLAGKPCLTTPSVPLARLISHPERTRVASGDCLFLSRFGTLKGWPCLVPAFQATAACFSGPRYLEHQHANDAPKGAPPSRISPGLSITSQLSCRSATKMCSLDWWTRLLSIPVRP